MYIQRNGMARNKDESNTLSNEQLPFRFQKHFQVESEKA